MDAAPTTADQVLGQLRSLTRSIQDYLAVEAKRHGLGRNEFIALIRAGDTDGVTGAQLAQAFGMRSSSVTGLADRLEEDGLIARSPHPTDRRIVVLRATRRGHAEIRKSLSSLYDQISTLAAALDPVALEVITTFLNDLELVLGRLSHTAAPR
jgi:DNA-binding MarR family transcriptional regulator